MTYKAMGAGFGAYYQFSPGQQYRGLGAADGVAGSFSATEVWANAQLGGSCYGPTPIPGVTEGQCNVAGMKAVQMLQMGLNALGYGPFPVTKSASDPITWDRWKQFLKDVGMPPGPAPFYLTQEGLAKMQAMLQAGAHPGPGPKQDFQLVGGEWVPKAPGLSKAGMLGLGLAGVALIGGLALFAKRKHALVPVGVR